MALSLVVGPANAGKVALLLERYLDALEHDPVLIVPNRSDVDRVERDLLRRRPALLFGSIGTFDDLFERVARGGNGARPVAGDAQRALVARRVVASASLNGLGRSARFGGFADALLQAVGELESGLLEPEDVPGDLAGLYAAYRAELDGLGLWDRDRLRRNAAERLATDLSAWNGSPVFAYGFEDLTGAEWRLLEALAGRTEVSVSLPYEPGRAAFASLRRTADDLAALAGPRIEELPPRHGAVAPPALAHLERALFEDAPEEPPPLDGAVRFLEGAGSRGVLELVGEELLDLIRSGVAPERIALVCPSLERLRAPLDTALATLGVPYAIEGRARFVQTPFGAALLSLLRFAWLGGGRRELYAFLRTPYSGQGRAAVDFLEGRLRGRAVNDGARAEEETMGLRDGRPLPPLELLRSASSPIAGVRALAASMLAAAHDIEAPAADEEVRQDLRAFDQAARTLAELEGWLTLGGALAPDEIVAALERATVPLAPAGEPGRVAVLDLLRARTRSFEVVFVLGLEQGSLPRRGLASPFLDDDARRALDDLPRARLVKADPVARDRYLFYTACTRATRRLYLVREAATDEGSPRDASPFWDEARRVFDREDVARWTIRRPLSSLTWRLEEAPTERERLRAVALVAAGSRRVAEELARANGWERRLERALGAFRRETRLTHPRVLEELGTKQTFNVTELERFADCSSAWFFERLLSPRTIDGEPDAKLRGSLAHTALHRFFAGLPKHVGSDRVTPGNLEAALAFMAECLSGALEGIRLELTDLQRLELEQGLRRDLLQAVRDEAASELPLEPRRFEVSFGSERSAPELQRGLDLGGALVSGKIDRIDSDPFSARGIVQDYKSGRTGHSASEIEQELRLQIPLYMLVLRDLVGIEPLGGVYRPLAGERKARGLLRASAREDGVPGFATNDYRDEEAFWGQVEGARELARGLAERIRAGDVRHDPKGNECPSWCGVWPMCRVRRA
jgi:ATP-dependent helicase/DNAse subunit B